MSWIGQDDAGGTPFERVLGLRPELLVRYKRFYGSLWEEGLVAPRLLELARLRIAAIHGCEAELAITNRAGGVSEDEKAALVKGDFSPFEDDLERAVLQVAEQIPHAHHFIPDEDVEAIKRHVEPSETVALMTGMALFDANCRLRLTFGVDITTLGVDQPASKDGSLY